MHRETKPRVRPVTIGACAIALSIFTIASNTPAHAAGPAPSESAALIKKNLNDECVGRAFGEYIGNQAQPALNLIKSLEASNYFTPINDREATYRGSDGQTYKVRVERSGWGVMIYDCYLVVKTVSVLDTTTASNGKDALVRFVVSESARTDFAEKLFSQVGEPLSNHGAFVPKRTGSQVQAALHHYDVGGWRIEWIR